MVIHTRPLPILGDLVNVKNLPKEAIFIVGDVHGQWDALTRLLRKMGATPTAGSARILVTLGDLVHKGPQSGQVLRAALGDEMRQKVGADRHVRILGNHEILLARALIALEQGSDGRAWIAGWAKSGGATLLTAWDKDQPGPWSERLARWRDSFTPGQLAGIGKWDRYWERGSLMAVHAGIAPDVDWSQMAPMDAYPEIEPRLRKHPHHWATVRAPFLDHSGGFDGKLVVHGHTPPRSFFSQVPKTHRALTQALDMTASKARLCLDGGAGYGVGVAGAVIHNGTMKLFFSSC